MSELDARPIALGNRPMRSDTVPSRRIAATRLYLQTVAAYDEIVTALVQDGPLPGLASVQRIVQRTVDCVAEDPFLLLGFGPIKALSAGAPPRLVRTHAVNTLVGAVALATDCGLSPQDRVRVGVAALLHDLGQDEERGSHGLATAGVLLRFADVEGVAFCAASALGRAAGSPGSGANEPVSAIVRIADAYDVLTGRTGAEGSPDLVLTFLLQHRSDRFDGALLRRFARMLGAYPPGTTVQLENRAVGVVVRPGAPEQPQRPLVRVLRDRNGTAVDDEIWTGAGADSVRIARSVDPAAFGIEPLHALLTPY